MMLAQSEPQCKAADNPLAELKRLDADVASACQRVMRSENTNEQPIAHILATATAMAAIVMDHPDDWHAFAKGIDLTESSSKGDGWQYRAVARAVWRKYTTKKNSRERVSQYGKAIRAAHILYWQAQNIHAVPALVDKMKVLGVRGVITALGRSDGVKGLKFVRIPIPDRARYALIKHDGDWSWVDGPEASQ